MVELFEGRILSVFQTCFRDKQGVIYPGLAGAEEGGDFEDIGGRANA
jgi:hypothetical protein